MIDLNELNIKFKEAFEGEKPVFQFEDFRKNIVKKDLILDKNPLPCLLKPYFLKYSDKEFFIKASEDLCSIINTVSEEYFKNSKVRDYLGIGKRIDSYARISPRYRGSQPVFRIDAFYDDSTKNLKVIEFNSDSPSCIGWHDCSLELYLKSNSIARLSQTYRFEYDYLSVHLARTLLTKYHEHCRDNFSSPSEKPNLILTCNAKSAFKNDFIAISKLLNKKSFLCEFSDPRSLEISNTQLFFKSKKIDLVYRDAIQDIIRTYIPLNTSLRENIRKYVLILSWYLSVKIRAFHKIVKNTQIGHPLELINFYKAGNICIVNPFRSYIAGTKNIMALMHEEDFKYLFTARQKQAINRFVPWTTIVDKDFSNKQNKQKTNKEMLMEKKDKLVLKADLGWGGHFCYIGFCYSKNEWENIIRKIFRSKNRYVCQELVQIIKKEFPIFKNGQYLGFKDLNSLMSLWSFDGKFGGAFVRASENSLINLRSGGLSPVFYAGLKEMA